MFDRQYDTVFVALTTDNDLCSPCPQGCIPRLYPGTGQKKITYYQCRGNRASKKRCLLSVITNTESAMRDFGSHHTITPYLLVIGRIKTIHQITTHPHPPFFLYTPTTDTPIDHLQEQNSTILLSDHLLLPLNTVYF